MKQGKGTGDLMMPARPSFADFRRRIQNLEFLGLRLFARKRLQSATRKGFRKLRKERATYKMPPVKGRLMKNSEFNLMAEGGRQGGSILRHRGSILRRESK